MGVWTRGKTSNTEVTQLKAKAKFIEEQVMELFKDICEPWNHRPRRLNVTLLNCESNWGYWMGELKAWNMEMNSQVNKRHCHPILQKIE